MLKIDDKKFEEIPEMRCDSHENYYKSTSNGFNETFHGAISRRQMGFPHAFTCYFSCVHKSQLFAAQMRRKKIEKSLSFF